MLGDASTVAIASASIIERRSHFKLAILNLYKEFNPLKPIEDFDKFRFGDLTYLRVYDLITANK